MRVARAVFAASTLLALGGPPVSAQAQLSLDWPAMAERIVRQLDLKPGERVLSLAQPGLMDAIVPHLRYAVARAGGVDLGVLEVMPEPVPEGWNLGLLSRSNAAARQAYRIGGYVEAFFGYDSNYNSATSAGDVVAGAAGSMRSKTTWPVIASGLAIFCAGMAAAYALWGDGDALRPSESSLYFTDRDGAHVWRLPRKMTDTAAAPEVVW